MAGGFGAPAGERRVQGCQRHERVSGLMPVGLVYRLDVAGDPVQGRDCAVTAGERINRQQPNGGDRVTESGEQSRTGA